MILAGPRQRRRRLTSLFVLTLATLATIFGLVWLLWILGTTFVEGFNALNLKLVTQMTPPPGQSGGLLNAFFGSFVMVLIAAAIGSPIGIAAGTFLAEYARGTRIGEVIRFVNDILLSAPSIVIGLFVYELVVRQAGHAGGIALAFILLPVVVRTTDEMLRLVPDVMREAALSLGIPRWKMVGHVLYRAAKAGILTGVLLGVARISGETAPLLFTALNNQYWTTKLSEPMANIPVVIFQYAMSPYEAWHTLAWAGAFAMTLFVLALSIVSRALLNRRSADNA